MFWIRLLSLIFLTVLILTQVILPTILNLPCFWLFSKEKRAQINFAFRIAGSDNQKKPK